jgi:hypothetical protein
MVVAFRRCCLRTPRARGLHSQCDFGLRRASGRRPSETRSNLAKDRTCPCLRVPEPRLRRLASAKAGDELRCGRTSTYAASPRWMET